MKALPLKIRTKYLHIGSKFSAVWGFQGDSFSKQFKNSFTRNLVLCSYFDVPMTTFFFKSMNTFLKESYFMLQSSPNITEEFMFYWVTLLPEWLCYFSCTSFFLWSRHVKKLSPRGFWRWPGYLKTFKAYTKINCISFPNSCSPKVNTLYQYQLLVIWKDHSAFVFWNTLDLVDHWTNSNSLSEVLSVPSCT